MQKGNTLKGLLGTLPRRNRLNAFNNINCMKAYRQLQAVEGRLSRLEAAMHQIVIARLRRSAPDEAETLR